MKVYIVVEVLFRAGDHVPEMPLVDIAGSAGITDPWQTGAIAVNSGVANGLMVTEEVAVVPGQPPVPATVYVTI